MGAEGWGALQGRLSRVWGRIEGAEGWRLGALEHLTSEAKTGGWEKVSEKKEGTARGESVGRRGGRNVTSLSSVRETHSANYRAELGTPNPSYRT